VERSARNEVEATQLRDQAAQALSQERSRSTSLEAQFRKNEVDLGQLQEKLRQRGADLTAVGENLRQAAEETAASFRASFVSAQLPGRIKILENITQGKGLPEIQNIETLWFLLLQEMTLAARVQRFPAQVVVSSGQTRRVPVTRVGNFAALAEGNYLEILPAESRLVALNPPASPDLRESIQELEHASTGWISLALDPTRGPLLRMLGRTPKLRERIEQGGGIGLVILALGVLALVLTLERLVVLGWIQARCTRQKKHPESPSAGNPLGRVLLQGQYAANLPLEILEHRLDEAILKELPRLTRGLRLIRLIATVTPLLGLLGTVTGMIVTFQQITLHGAGDPRLLAGGISQALVTTALGLGVAIPTVFLHRLASARSEALVQLLEEQSAGLLVSTWKEEAP
jgi:biopolymer transport protein ExbB